MWKMQIYCAVNTYSNSGSVYFLTFGPVTYPGYIELSCKGLSALRVYRWMFTHSRDWLTLTNLTRPGFEGRRSGACLSAKSSAHCRLYICDMDYWIRLYAYSNSRIYEV